MNTRRLYTDRRVLWAKKSITNDGVGHSVRIVSMTYCFGDPVPIEFWTWFISLRAIDNFSIIIISPSKDISVSLLDLFSTEEMLLSA